MENMDFGVPLGNFGKEFDELKVEVQDRKAPSVDSVPFELSLHNGPLTIRVPRVIKTISKKRISESFNNFINDIIHIERDKAGIYKAICGIHKEDAPEQYVTFLSNLVERCEGRVQFLMEYQRQRGGLHTTRPLTALDTLSFQNLETALKLALALEKETATTVLHVQLLAWDRDDQEFAIYLLQTITKYQELEARKAIDTFDIHIRIALRDPIQDYICFASEENLMKQILFNNI